MADSETPDRKDADTRRVYTLPGELLARLRAYQVSQNIPSEVEAARRLLDSALQMRDTVFDILARLEAKLIDEKDLRVLASEVLVKHALVTSIVFDEEGMTFNLLGGDRGQATKKGKLFFSESGYNSDRWLAYPKPPEVPTRAKPVRTEWDNGGGDLDDEIPF